MPRSTAMLCYVMPCYVMLCHATQPRGTALSEHITSNHGEHSNDEMRGASHLQRAPVGLGMSESSRAKPSRRQVKPRHLQRAPVGELALKACEGMVELRVSGVEPQALAEGGTRTLDLSRHILHRAEHAVKSSQAQPPPSQAKRPPSQVKPSRRQVKAPALRRARGRAAHVSAPSAAPCPPPRVPGRP
jgi:hypothetical protein